MAKKKKSNWDNLEPQKSSAAQYLTYIASVGQVDERFEIRYEDENIWMSQKMLAQVYGVEVPNISYHLRKLFQDAELDKNSVIKEILITAQDGKKYTVNHYNLQVIIALGFKIDNEKAVAFRKWANQIVSEYTIKGWVMDVPRLKDGSPITDKYFEHQLERIREIRLSERKFYQKITDLYATAIDYDKTSNLTRIFYATVQNRMHCAVHGHTDDELGILERMVNAFLEYAETQTMRKIPLTMEDWKTRLDKFLTLFDQHAPKYAGDPIDAYKAQLYAESEFEKYRIIQDKLFMSDYDRYLLALEEEIKRDRGESKWK